MTTSMPKQTILFDMDDTLIYCNKYFDIVIHQFLDTMTTWFNSSNMSAQEIKSVQSKFDIAGVQKNGFQSEHFPRSFIDTYDHLCNLTGRDSSEEEKEQLWKLGLSVYDMEIEPYPGMVETLELLRDQGHELYLYTGGEPVIQQRKIDQMKLSAYFGDRIFIRQHKTAEALAEIVKEQGFSPANTWMIGNSVRTDVQPALLAGLHAIYLKRPNEWLYNVIDIEIEPQGALYTLEKLADVPRVIEEWLLASKLS
ncbi:MULTISPECIES: HAD family hydrolase [Paenibacillus]|uniref:HAD family hydrolase n=1 Tax=Paenibacillus alvei TaxID=44250 RepID=A0ABT4EBF6_PAEAL|nr:MULTISPECIES: HAD family hydrolase [Paenibacillus]MCY9529833.1 HAD family hydrolase [Paenibacillus alvei]SDE75950.1 putative hydrolase of the HAD superfamily [Paenibacillus sp. cl6col]